METVETRNPELVESLRTKLLEALGKATVPKLSKPRWKTKEGKSTHQRSNVIGDIGRTMTFGFGNTRRGIKDYKTNSKYPDLMKALVDYGNAILPVGFFYNGITLNHGVKAKKHVDSLNIGVSYITGLGEYTGGELEIWSSDTESVKVDLNKKIVGFNGALMPHQTCDFEGNRYTIIYYKQKWNSPVTGYETIGK